MTLYTIDYCHALLLCLVIGCHHVSRKFNITEHALQFISEAGPTFHFQFREHTLLQIGTAQSRIGFDQWERGYKQESTKGKLGKNSPGGLSQKQTLR